MTRLAHRNRHQVDEGVAKNRGLCRGDKGCRHVWKRFERRVVGDGVDCIHVGHDHRHHLREPRHAVISQSRQLDSLHAV